MGHSLPNCDVRVTSAHPSISDMMLGRRECRNGPLSELARLASSVTQALPKNDCWRMSGDKGRVAKFYLRAEIVEADQARHGLPSGDVLRAKSSTTASILLRVGSSALASPATTGAAISVMKPQYSSADFETPSSPTTCFTAMSFRPPLRDAASINPGAAHRNNPGDPRGGVGNLTCLLIVPITVVAHAFHRRSHTVVHTRPPGFATRTNSFTLRSTSGKNMKPNLHSTASNERSGNGSAPASH